MLHKAMESYVNVNRTKVIIIYEHKQGKMKLYTKMSRSKYFKTC